MKEKLKEVFGNIRSRVTSAFMHSASARGGEREVEELFVERKGSRPFVLSVFFTTCKFMLIGVLLLGCAGLGLVLGVAKAYIDTTPELDVSLLTKSDRTSYIYDMNGKLISTFAGYEYRDWVDIEAVPDMLKNAVIAIEDVRFYRHGGVDYKRLFAAVVGSLSASSDAGGSTLTQQLVKNKLLTSEVSYRRKIQEAYLALQVENAMDKDEILEAYLNDVYLGQSNYGMKAAAKDYFGKELSELSIRECAMLAGMIKAPNSYDPRRNTYSRTYTSGDKAGQNKMDITNSRTDTVIKRMYQAGFITYDQMQTALNDNVYIVEKRQSNKVDDMLYFVEYAIRDIEDYMLEERGLLDTSANRSAIESELSRGGYSIYLTVDTEMQHIVQNTLATWEDYPGVSGAAGEDKIPQSAAVVIDQKTGELRAIVGGREAPEVRKGWNRAYQSATEVGSSIKPLSVYGPALDLGLSPASAVVNIPDPIVGWDTETGYPAIGSEKYEGIITLRRGVVSSLNVAAARTLLEDVSLQTGADYLAKLGVDPSRIKTTGSGLALGAMGITPIEMAGAYAAIANEGKYIKPVSFSRVVDQNGKVILDSSKLRTEQQVFKPTTAYMLVDILHEAVESGTGTAAKIKGLTVAGKTGTNSDYGSAYFAGMTGYYTAVVWVGPDKYEYKLSKGSTGGKVAAPIWRAFMKEILNELPDKQIIDASPVELGLVQRTVCSLSGKLATEACAFDASGHVPVTDWFASDSVPVESCDMHALAGICSASGQAAGPYCPADGIQYQSVAIISSTSRYKKYDPLILIKYLPNLVYSDVPVAEYGMYTAGGMCSVHYSSWSGGGLFGGYAETDAKNLIATVRDYLAKVQNLPDTDRATLESGIEQLESYLASSGGHGFIQSYYDRLKYNYSVISSDYPPPANVTVGGNSGSISGGWGGPDD